MNRREKAEAYFKEGYNCAQSVVLAFSDLLPEEEDTLKKLSSGFGGGFGRLRELCGAVSGMGIVLGYLYGYDDPSDPEAKKAQYARIQECALPFEEKCGSVVCRELLHLKDRHDEPTPDPRTPGYYEKRPCQGFVGEAAEILENYIETHGKA